MRSVTESPRAHRAAAAPSIRYRAGRTVAAAGARTPEAACRSARHDGRDRSPRSTGPGAEYKRRTLSPGGSRRWLSQARRGPRQGVSLFTKCASHQGIPSTRAEIYAEMTRPARAECPRPDAPEATGHVPGLEALSPKVHEGRRPGRDLGRLPLGLPFQARTGEGASERRLPPSARPTPKTYVSAVRTARNSLTG